MINAHIKNKYEVTLKKYNPIDVASVFSGLLLNPKYQSHQYRLEVAIKICLVYCRGDKKPNKKLIENIYNDMETFGISVEEDPAEDIFISKLWFNNKSYKVALGLWEGCIQQTQLFLTVLESLPDENIYFELNKKIKSVLEVSNLIIQKNKLNINEIGNENFLDSILDSDLKKIDFYINCIKTNNIDNYLLPIMNGIDFKILDNDEFGNSVLELNPFYIKNDKVILLLPTAITISIRRLILDFFIKNNKKNDFVKIYTAFQSKQIYDTRIFGKLSKSPIQFYRKEGIDNFKFAENTIEFDTNHFFHFIFLIDRLENIEEKWFADFLVDYDNKILNFLESRIDNAKQNILAQDINNKGCSLIVMCGIGRGYAFGLNINNDSYWYHEVISIGDLITLSNDVDCKPQLIWRIIEAQNKLESLGTKILNFNGLLNLYGYVKDNNYSIFLNENIDEEINPNPISIIQIGNNYNLYIREKVAQDTGFKEVMHPNGNILIVRRAYPNSLFSTNLKYNLYIPETINKNTFQVVYINYGYVIWIEQNMQYEFDFTLQYKLFDTLVTWFSKILYILNENNISINSHIELWKIEYELVNNISNLKKDISKDQVLNSFTNMYDDSVLSTSFNINILKGFMFEQNYSEQAIIMSFLKFLNIDKLDINNVLNKIIISENARLLHFFMAHRFRDFFKTSEQKPIYIQQIDEQNIKLNLGWTCRNKEDGNIIKGKNECTQYLNKLMAVVWKILQQKLKQIDREKLIFKLLINYEYCDSEKNIWEQTFRSNLSLHSDKKNTYEVAINKISQLNSATLSSRLVIEMAICECSVNCGKNVGILDIQELMSLASFMHIIGGLSEAIKYDAIPPKLMISSFGDVLFDHSFNDLTIEKYGHIFNKKVLDSKTSEYSENFKEKDYVQETNHLFDKEFTNAFIEEFGYTIDEARIFLDFLEDYGLKINKLVYSINYTDLIEEFDTQHKEIFIKILNSLSIHPRREWTKIPKPYKSTDWQPWKFRRRYSVIMKPIVEVDSFENLLVISPELIRTAFLNLVININEASLEAEQFQSKKMIQWIGSKKKDKGLSFNSLVKEKFIELNYNAIEEIKLTKILNKKMKDFGDIDVLAWSEEKNIVYAIECKNLELAKTQSEIARQLYGFKGQINDKNKKDRLYKHHIRLEELKKDLHGVMKFTKLNKNFTLQGLVVFSNIVPMNFNKNRNFIDEIDFFTIDDLEST